jgi:hypothetical protein
LYNWGKDTEEDHDFLFNKLSKIKGDLVGRQLVSQLLDRDPKKRPPSMKHVLSHAFFTGKYPLRLPGDDALFDVFLSYRVDSDYKMAESLYNMLTAKGVKVWWDKKCLKDGVDWEKGFCEGIVNSRAFVPLISASAIEERFMDLVPTSWCDNVLLEHRISLELQERNLIEFIFPVFISLPVIAEDGTESYPKYYPNKSICSSAVVEQVENKLRHHLLECGQGLPIIPPMRVVDVLDKICKCNGDFFMTPTPPPPPPPPTPTTAVSATTPPPTTPTTAVSATTPPPTTPTTAVSATTAVRATGGSREDIIRHLTDKVKGLFTVATPPAAPISFVLARSKTPEIE